MQKGLIFPLIMALSGLALISGTNPLLSPAHHEHPGAWLQIQNLSEMGWSLEQLKKARTFAEQIGSAAVMLIHRGHVVVAWGDIERPFRTHSVRKSLVSALIGIAAADGRMDLSVTMGELGIDDLQPLTATEKSATLEQLISARSGIYHPAAKETSGHRQTRPQRGSHAPGERWWYNNWDFNLSGLIYEMVMGESLGEAFLRRIAEPLGMQDYTPADFWYQPEPTVSRHPAWGFRMSARDRARFGLLYLNRGKVKGRRIVPEEWVTRSTSPVSDLGSGRGYGYMWWTYNHLKDEGLLSRRVYTAVGGNGQAIMVIPDLDMVIVHCDDSDWDKTVRGSDVWKLADSLTAAFSGESAIDPVLAPVQSEPFASPLPQPYRFCEIDLPVGVLMRYEGTFVIEGMGTVVFKRIGRRLLAKPDNMPSLLLRAASSTRFFAPSLNGMIDFHPGDQGPAIRLRLTWMGRHFFGQRTVD